MNDDYPQSADSSPQPQINNPLPNPNKSLTGRVVGVISVSLLLILLVLYALAKNQQNPTNSGLMNSNGKPQTGEEMRRGADVVFLQQSTNPDSLALPSKQAQEALDQAWEKFYGADYDASIADFKLAYTTDSNSPNPNVPEFYLVLGLILSKRGNYDGSIKILEKGIDTYPQNTRMICNLAYSYVNKYVDNPPQNLSFLNTSIDYFKEAELIDPDDANCQYFWSFAEFYKGNYAESWKHVIKLEQLGATMDAIFLEYLSKKMPRP